MSWKTREEKPINRGIISHTITGPFKKQETPSVVVLPSQPYVQQQHGGMISTRHSWPKALMIKYYAGLQEKGFKVGARVRTKYGRQGVIAGFLEPPETFNFFGQHNPNCILISSDGSAIAQDTVLRWSEDELTVIEGEATSC